MQKKNDGTTTTTPHNTTVLRPFFWDHPGEPVPGENLWTLWCKGRLTEADTLTIQLGPPQSNPKKQKASKDQWSSRHADKTAQHCDTSCRASCVKSRMYMTDILVGESVINQRRQDVGEKWTVTVTGEHALSLVPHTRHTQAIQCDTVTLDQFPFNLWYCYRRRTTPLPLADHSRTKKGCCQVTGWG